MSEKKKFGMEVPKPRSINPVRIQYRADELCQVHFGTPTWLMNKLFIGGGINILAGEVSSGKTFLSLDLAISVASNVCAWDNRSTINGSVLYFCLDSPPRIIQNRVKALCAGKKISHPNNLMFDFSPLNFRIPETFRYLREIVKSNNIQLIVFDVLARYTAGLDENAAAAMSPLMTNLRELSNETGVTLLILHHLNKGFGSGGGGYGLRVRGSTDIIGAVDATVVITTSGERTNLIRKITPEKNREDHEEPPMGFSIMKGENGEVFLNFDGYKKENEVLTRNLRDDVGDLLLKTMRGSPGISHSKQELMKMVKDSGKQCSDSTLNRFFSGMGQGENINVEKRGRQIFYTYIGNSVQTEI